MRSMFLENLENYGAIGIARVIFAIDSGEAKKIYMLGWRDRRKLYLVIVLTRSW